MKARFLGVIAGLTFVCAASLAHSSSCLLDDCGFLDNGGVYTTLTGPSGSIQIAVYGINNKGEVVGNHGTSNATYGFVYSNGKYTTLNVPGSLDTAAWGINDKGAIVGSYGNGTAQFGFSL